MKKQAAEVASKGRYGDTMLVHMNPVEVQMMHDNLPGGLTVNPDTGQPEAFLPLLLALGGGALAPTLGLGMSAAMGAGLGSFAGSLMQGDDFKDAAMGGMLSYGLGSMFSGMGDAALAGGATPASAATGASSASAADAKNWADAAGTSDAFGNANFTNQRSVLSQGAKNAGGWFPLAGQAASANPMGAAAMGIGALGGGTNALMSQGPQPEIPTSQLKTYAPLAKGAKGVTRAYNAPAAGHVAGRDAEPNYLTPMSTYPGYAEGGEVDVSLTPDSDEVTKEDYKTFNRIFSPGERGGGLSENEVNNALMTIIKNRTKWKDDPFTPQEIRDMSLNQRGRLGDMQGYAVGGVVQPGAGYRAGFDPAHDYGFTPPVIEGHTSTVAPASTPSMHTPMYPVDGGGGGEGNNNPSAPPAPLSPAEQMAQAEMLDTAEKAAGPLGVVAGLPGLGFLAGQAARLSANAAFPLNTPYGFGTVGPFTSTLDLHQQQAHANALNSTSPGGGPSMSASDAADSRSSIGGGAIGGGGYGSSSAGESNASGGDEGGGGGYTCFHPDTPIVMADGTTKRIADIEVGDLVSNTVGGENEVLEIDNPKLGTRKLYSINGGREFVTWDHPLLSEKGWVAISPENNIKGDLLKLGKLEVGTVLLTIDGPDVVDTIEEFEHAASLILSDLHLDGNHKYFANGFVVHNCAMGGEVRLDGDPRAEQNPILDAAVAAIKGQHPNPEQAIQGFIKQFGQEAFVSLRQQVIAEATSDQRNQSGLGGLIRGPGTGTSDSIPGMITQNGQPVEQIKVADGEYIMPKATVDKVGKNNLDNVVAATTGKPANQ